MPAHTPPPNQPLSLTETPPEAESAEVYPWCRSSGYANNLGALRSLGLLDYPVPGQVVASAMLFLDQAATV